MFKNFTLFILLICFANFSSIAQFEGKVYKQIANESIKQLKNGVLLVRLSKKQSAIEALEKVGQVNTANQLIERQKELNEKIVNAFETEFNFCPTYFFYSEDSKKIRNGDLDKVAWLNKKNLEVDESITINAANYFIAEFSYSEQDTAKYYSDSYQFFGKNGTEIRHKYYGGSNLRQDGLIVKSNQFVQLPKPFPRFIKKSMFSDPKTVHALMVSKLNKKLMAFYNEKKP